VLLNALDAPLLNTEALLREFVESLHGATGGNPAILKRLIEGFDQWREFDSKRARCHLAKVWKSFDGQPAAPDAFERLKHFCTLGGFPLPPSMIHTIFEDPSFDCAAYLKWHESDACRVETIAEW
jgi:hypothetical protein